MKTNIPSFLYITTAKAQDVNILDLISLEVGSFDLVDMGYIDYQRHFRFHTHGSFFVTRAKDIMRFKRIYSRKVDKTHGVLSDQIGKLETYHSSKHYPEKIRSIRFYLNHIFDNIH